MVDSTLRALETTPRRAAEDLRKATELAAELGAPAPAGADDAAQRGDLAQPPLRDARRTRWTRSRPRARRAGGTINDAVLAIVAGMLRLYFEHAGTDLGGKPAVALVPVSVRRRRQAG